MMFYDFGVFHAFLPSVEAHTDGLVNEAAALLKAALEPHAPAEAESKSDESD